MPLVWQVDPVEDGFTRRNKEQILQLLFCFSAAVANCALASAVASLTFVLCREDTLESVPLSFAILAIAGSLAPFALCHFDSPYQSSATGF